MIVGFLFLVVALILSEKPKPEPKTQEITPLDESYMIVLSQKFDFYKKLGTEDKKGFEHDVNIFFKDYEIHKSGN